MTRTRVLAALLAGLTLTGVGTAAVALGSDNSTAPTPVTVVAQTRSTTSTPTSTSTSTSTLTPTVDAAAPAALTADEAVSRAVAHLGGGTATKVERETEHGRTVWEVEVATEARVTEVHVDTATGTITRVRDDGRDDRGRGRDDRGGDDHGRHGGDDRFDDKGGDR